jgi:hypothetical protein
MNFRSASPETIIVWTMNKIAASESQTTTEGRIRAVSGTPAMLPGGI